MYEIELKNVADNLPLLLAEINQGDEIVLTVAQHPIAKITKIESKTVGLAHERGAKAAALLEQLAQRNTFSEIVDPVAWQRETRQDRQLPGRE